MIFSIRRFLYINLLGTLALSFLVIGIANYLIDERVIHQHSYKERGAAQSLQRHVAIDGLLILFCVFPISGMFIWFIVSKGLNSIVRVTNEVAQRSPHHLESVQISAIPVEIEPLIKELNSLFSRLDEALAREQRFAADAAHELRTPLTALKVGAQVALITNDADKKNQAIEKFIKTIDRSIHIVQQLLTMSTLTPDNYGKTQLKLFNLVPVVKEVIGLMVPLADKKCIELSLETSHPIVKFKGNDVAIIILMRNLIDNAIRYSSFNTQVVIRILSEPHRVGIEVIDQGVGISTVLKKRVLERFYRVVGSKEAGSGLGLAIVQKICHIHHGYLKLLNNPEGKGLVVQIWFAHQ